MLLFLSPFRAFQLNQLSMLCVYCWHFVVFAPRFWFIDLNLPEKNRISLSFWDGAGAYDQTVDWFANHSEIAPKLEPHCHTIMEHLHLLHYGNSRVHLNKMNCIPTNQLLKCCNSEINRRAFIYGNQMLSTKFLQHEFQRNEKHEIGSKHHRYNCTILFIWTHRIAFNSAKK